VAGDLPPAGNRKKLAGKLLSGAVETAINRAGKSAGPVGMVVGAVAKRVVTRSPVTALVVGGAWIGHKLYKRNQERKFDEAARNAKPAKVIEKPPVTPGE